MGQWAWRESWGPNWNPSRSKKKQKNIKNMISLQIRVSVQLISFYFLVLGYQLSAHCRPVNSLILVHFPDVYVRKGE